jgi:phosphoserine phosphatase RsbU/P
LAGILTEIGHSVDTAGGGAEAIDILRSTEYDAVLLDIMMPDITGLDILRMAADVPELARAPFIMVSAKVQASDVQAAMDLGAIEYIRKPIDEIELLARLKTVLKIRKQDLQLKELNATLLKTNKIITSSIEAAKKIQSSIFPAQQDLERILPGSFVYFRPKDSVSGDFFWQAQLGSISIIVEADCTGHGVSGAFLSLIASALLDKIVLQNGVVSPSKILGFLNRDFTHSLNKNAGSADDFIFDGMDVSIVCIDSANKKASLAAAGQDVLVIKTDGQIERIKGNLFSIGYEVEALNGGVIVFEEIAIDFEATDSLVLFSDGFIDQFGGPSDEKFLLKRFVSIIENSRAELFRNPNCILDKALNQWKGSTAQTDDILVIGIDISRLRSL